MTKARQIEQYWQKGGVFGLMLRAALRTFQFVLAVTIAGLYGVDLAHATKTKQHAQAEWIYAEFVAALSAITCIVHCFATVTRVAWSAWDGVLFILWLAQVGVFGSAYVSNVQDEYRSATTSVQRMRVAVWLDLISMILWFATTVLGIAWCIRARKVVRRTDQLDAGDEETGAFSRENSHSSDEGKDLLHHEKGNFEGVTPKGGNGVDIKVQSPPMEGDEKGDSQDGVKS